ncbi:MAG: apolipoprotein N-acyltransferase [Xanthomonadales bacterium]|nr:apolipoprotein N-acyltransferase [Xanthomonadales bacterium]
MATSEPTESTRGGRIRQTLAVLGAIAASGVLLAFYARGGWGFALGFVALVPWLWALERQRSTVAVFASAVLMAAGFALAVLGWFGPAFGAYVGIDATLATVLFVLLGPLLQPQFLAFAAAWHALRRGPGAVVQALAAAAAWVGCEWLLPKLLGDTLGHGLQPSLLLRQAADLGGAALLTVLLLLVNVALARALVAGRGAWRALGTAALLVAMLAGYGSWRLSALRAVLSEPAPALRIGLVQANLTDLERRRAERGTFATVRELLDTHFAMSEHAVRAQGAEALLWSETVYPTTFGTSKSEEGAAFDQEIGDFVGAMGVPLVFGTYDRDAQGEYNSAAFVDPARGLLGHYRKTHLFPFTEWVPEWIDGPGLRRWLPWTGRWRPGDGARVFPLTLADGREANVVPLICLDDVRPQLAIDGARLGAQALVGLSNDSWFTAHPEGARLHLAVASFRSIETRLPQLRATTNGLSAVIDESGEVVVHTEMGQQAVLVGEIPLRAPVPTLMLHLGDWVGPVALGFLALLAAAGVWRRRPRASPSSQATPPASTPHAPIAVVLLAPSWRIAAMLLRIGAALTLAWLGWRMLAIDGLQVNSLLQVRGFVLGVALPLVLAWAIRHVHAATARVEAATLVFESRAHRLDLPIASIACLHATWAGGPGAALRLGLASGRRWPITIALADPQAFASLLAGAGSAATWATPRAQRLAEFAALRATGERRWLEHAAIKFLLFPLLPALLAFRLHQHIAFGGTFGELQSYGPIAWLTGLLIWWAAWSLGLMLLAAALRVLSETLSATVFLVHRDAAPATSRLLHRFAQFVYYLGTPAWLVSRLLWG